ncbi:DUF3883 domain-containing protein [bacterium]|nr:MAG: DUF3883 domain-containing protein [bacterium]
MSASSDRRLELFAKLETKQVQCLLNALFQSTMHGKQFVETAYCERARNFAETLQFLKDINWVNERRGELILSDAGYAANSAAQDDEEIRKRLTESLIAEVNPYRADLADYLLRFRLSGVNLAYRPSLSERLLQSPLRNFLMDIRAVTYRASDDTYLIEEGAVDLYVWAINFRRSTSKQMLQFDAKRKEQLGFAAEIAILEYERDRVGTRWANKVEHVSAGSPFACYDVKSVTVRSCDAVPRYIEVKAVPSDSYQFYWTRSEVEVAQLLKEKYFLYLLPVSTSGSFDLKRILIVDDPYVSVYRSSEAWQIEENVIVCRRTEQI